MTDEYNNSNSDGSVESLSAWIRHLKYVRDNPNREEPAEYYQKLIEYWEKKLSERKFEAEKNE